MLTEVSNIFEEERIESAYNILKYDTELDKLYKVENDALIEKSEKQKLKKKLKLLH